jgi:hypothetical protein
MRRLSLFLLLLLAASPLLAQSGVWGARGVSHAFLVRDNLVYDVDGRGVAVYDVSNPAAIRRTAVIDSEAESLDGAFLANGDLAVLTRAGVDIYDRGTLGLRAQIPGHGFAHLRANENWIVAASANGATAWANDLTEVRRMTFASAVSAIALKGDALYAALGEGGVDVVDLTGARDVSVLAENAQDLAVAGDNLYVASGVNGLVVADATDPFAPRVTRREGAGTMNLAHVAVAGTKIFASESPSTIHVFDDAGEVARIDDAVQTLAASGTRLFVSGTIFDKFGLPTETGLPLRVYDVAAAPKLLGDVKDLAGPVSGAATDGTLAYIVDRPFFRVIDVSTTSAPRELASLAIDNIEDHVKLLGKQVILYGRGDVDLVDVSDPYHPKLAKVFHSFGRPPSNAAFARNTIVEGNPWSGFHVVDFINYPEPGQIGGIKGHYYEVVANGGDVAYIAGEGVSIAAIDLRDPHNPVGTKLIHVGVKQAFITGNDLVVRSSDGLHVYSLADPFNPTETSFVPMTEPGVAGPADGAALVWIDDALVRADLAAGTAVASGLTALAPMQIDGAGGKTVVADRYGLRVFGPNTAPPPPPPPQPPARRRAARP